MHTLGQSCINYAYIRTVIHVDKMVGLPKVSAF